MNFQLRSYKKELLDRDDLPFADIRLNMQELDQINTRLGGHAITISGVKKLLGTHTHIHICEIGCGGGDNLLAVYNWCSKRNINATFTGIDIKEACIDYANTRGALSLYTTWLVSDYRTVVFEKKPDVIFSSLFCHHFTESELKEQLNWMMHNSNKGFFINDLHRHWMAYYSIKLLTRIFSKSYLVKNDAPLSVARGFKKKEWNQLLQACGIKTYQVKWRWAFRYLITVTK